MNSLILNFSNLLGLRIVVHSYFCKQILEISEKESPATHLFIQWNTGIKIIIIIFFFIFFKFNLMP